MESIALSHHMKIDNKASEKQISVSENQLHDCRFNSFIIHTFDIFKSQFLNAMSN